MSEKKFMKFFLICQEMETKEDIDRCFATLKQRESDINEEVINSYHVKQSVSFKGKRGVMMHGIVEKIGRKNIVVRTERYGKWRVPASMLEPIK